MQSKDINEILQQVTGNNLHYFEKIVNKNNEIIKKQKLIPQNILYKLTKEQTKYLEAINYLTELNFVHNIDLKNIIKQIVHNKEIRKELLLEHNKDVQTIISCKAEKFYNKIIYSSENQKLFPDLKNKIIPNRTLKCIKCEHLAYKLNYCRNCFDNGFGTFLQCAVLDDKSAVYHYMHIIKKHLFDLREQELEKKTTVNNIIKNNRIKQILNYSYYHDFDLYKIMAYYVKINSIDFKIEKINLPSDMKKFIEQYNKTNKIINLNDKIQDNLYLLDNYQNYHKINEEIYTEHINSTVKFINRYLILLRNTNIDDFDEIKRKNDKFTERETTFAKDSIFPICSEIYKRTNVVNICINKYFPDQLYQFGSNLTLDTYAMIYNKKLHLYLPFSINMENDNIFLKKLYCIITGISYCAIDIYDKNDVINNQINEFLDLLENSEKIIIQ